MIRALALAIGLAAGSAAAECRLALLLALDVSFSVDGSEDRLQRQGLARALRSDAVVAAILSAPGRSVALSAFEWSGRGNQSVILDWRLLSSQADVDAAAATIAASRRSAATLPTALGYAIGFAAAQFRAAPDCAARTLDISGDGVNNEGFDPGLAYQSFDLRGVTVNGLAIGGAEEGLAAYYRAEVIRGPGAFVIEARDFVDFERAMAEKLIRETQTRAIGQVVR